MPTNGLNKGETLAAWSDIVLKIWHEKIVDLKVWETGDLNSSLLHTLMSNAGTDADKVEFSFLLYGVWVDMGVGHEISVGNSGDLGFTPVRKRKEWYSRIFYGQVMKLREIFMEKFGESAAKQVVSAMNPVKDLKYAQAKGLNPYID